MLNFKIIVFFLLIPFATFASEHEEDKPVKRTLQPKKVTIPPVGAMEPVRAKKKLKTSDSLHDESVYALGETVTLQRGKGGRDTGGDVGGFFWKVYNNDILAGKVFINYIDEEPVGEHASIQIFLNKQSQGKHIGRFAYAKACEEGSYDEVYAHMRKGNIASRKAAEAAGFKAVSMAGISQLLLKWTRKAR